MKFWKHSLLAASVFLGIASTVTYTSCVHDSCKAIICRNGGTCDNELCLCPDGWEGTQCEIRSAQKFVGKYDGQIKVNSLPVRIDTAEVYYANGNDTTSAIEAYFYTRLPEKLVGRAVNDHVVGMGTNGQKVTFKYLGDDKIEVLIDEMVNGERVITNFSGTKRAYNQ